MSNIADVIDWKFNSQEGMRCKMVDGVMVIHEFPNVIPSQSDQDLWAAEYETHLLIETRRQEILTRLDELDMLSIRALRSKGIGRGNSQDDTTLSDLDDEAVSLRDELSNL